MSRYFLGVLNEGRACAKDGCVANRFLDGLIHAAETGIALQSTTDSIVWRIIR